MRTSQLVAILLILSLPFKCLFGQEMLGTVLGNYSGVDNTRLNPSAMNNSKVFLDVRFLGMDAFVENNYLYQTKSDYSITHFFQSGYQWPTHTEDYGTEVRIFYANKSEGLKDLYVSNYIGGPSAMLVWRKHAFALTTAIRTVASGRDIPYDVANFGYLGLNYRPQHNINYNDSRPFQLSQATWAEIGLAYSYEIRAEGLNLWTAGIDVRRLFGLGGEFMSVTNINYIVPDDSTIIVKNLNARYGVAYPLDYSSSAYTPSLKVLGKGFAFDVGATFYRLKRVHQENYSARFCEPPHEDYLYRIGVSLIDLGAIRFTSNASQYSIDNKSSYWNNVNNIHFRNIQQILDTLSLKFYGTTDGAYRGNSFYLWLPSAGSVQFDYHYYRNWYINATAIIPFVFTGNSLSRPAQIAITPRYETDWFEASLPVSLYNWYLPRIGLSLRFWYFTVGMDKLGYLFSFNNFTGMDFYFNIKFFMQKGICRSRGPKGCQEKSYQVKSKF
jgi:hypothetical protein